jgi:hypothetical protein
VRKSQVLPVVAISSDEVRVFARKGMKIVVDGGDLYLSAKHIYHSDKSDNVEPHVLGETLKGLLSDVISILSTITS